MARGACDEMGFPTCQRKQKKYMASTCGSNTVNKALHHTNCPILTIMSWAILESVPPVQWPDSLLSPLLTV